MKIIFRKILGATLMSIPFWGIFWLLGKSIGAGMWEGFLIFTLASIVLVGVLVGLVLIFLLAETGSKLYKGEKIQWRN